jgi:hypothetical protein
MHCVGTSIFHFIFSFSDLLADGSILRNAASLLLGMNDDRSDKSSRQRSDSPFSFPRQKRSKVRQRFYLSIESDSE